MLYTRTYFEVAFLLFVSMDGIDRQEWRYTLRSDIAGPGWDLSVWWLSSHLDS